MERSRLRAPTATCCFDPLYTPSSHLRRVPDIQVEKLSRVSVETCLCKELLDVVRRMRRGDFKTRLLSKFRSRGGKAIYCNDNILLDEINAN